MLFPIVGPVQYRDDFGEPRAGHPHEGNDIMAARRAPVIAVEAGSIKFWTTSAAAGCMLYLRGDSGTMYEYIHLNNDLTAGNDNRGSCVAGVAYAAGLKDGDKVAAGQLVAYVGDSGDANGGATHLHFEVHPNGGGAVDPYPYLQHAQPVLFAATPGSTFTLALRGTLVAAAGDSMTLAVSAVRVWPGGTQVNGLARELTIAVPPSTLVIGKPGLPNVSSLPKGQHIVVLTTPAPATLQAQLGATGALTAATVSAS
jgi:hypothetical protein